MSRFSPGRVERPPFTWLQATTSTPSVRLSHTPSPDVAQAVPVHPGSATRPLRRDWGEAIDVSAFYGRERELVELARWIVEERCRLVALLSRGGYGKTTLAVKLTQQIETDERFPRHQVWHRLLFSRRYHIILLYSLMSEQQRLFATRDWDT